MALIYFRDGKVVAESGEVKIYEMEDELFLEIGPGHNLWALSSELEDYIEQLGDTPTGKCLEIGLGLGVASNYILSFRTVTSLTTVEINPDIIEAYKQVQNKYYSEFTKDKPHHIINKDGLVYAYETNEKYDFVFFDFYDLIDEDTLPVIMDMHKACQRVLKPNGKILGWIDKHTPADIINEFLKIF